MKNIFSIFRKLNLLVYVLICLLLIVYLLAYTDIELSERFNNLITPLITLFTGVIIFSTLRENQKSNKELSLSNKIVLSEKLYDRMVEKINKHISKKDITFTGVAFRDGMITEGEDFDIYFHKIAYSTVDNWYGNVLTMLKEMKKEKVFPDLLKQHENGIINVDNFDNMPYAYLCDKVDFLLLRVRAYYSYLQRELYNLLSNEYDDFILQDRSFLIDKIVTETNYDHFFFHIGKYFHVNEKDEMEFTTNYKGDNIKVLEKELGTKDSGSIGLLVRERYLVQWSFFKEMYETHLQIVKMAEKESRELLGMSK